MKAGREVPVAKSAFPIYARHPVGIALGFLMGLAEETPFNKYSGLYHIFCDHL